jgi:nudix-type nucleoside diphosphatase (YffH/AdpP family)
MNEGPIHADASASGRIASEARMAGLPRVVGRRRVFKGWNAFDVLTVETVGSDGTLSRHDREVVDHGDATVVLPVDRERGVAILVRQWRAGLLGRSDPYLLEACAGIVDPGETPEAAARREAEEETGLVLGEVRHVGTIVPSAGTLTERMHLFVADIAGGRLAERGGNRHEGEDIEVLEVPLATLYEMARRGEIGDAKTLVIVQRLLIEELEGPQPG